MSSATRKMNQEIEKARSVYPEHLVELSREAVLEATAKHPDHHPPARAWCSRRYTVMLFLEGDRVRLSCSVARVRDDGGWEQNISWDDLQRLKREAGFGDRWAVECYPPDFEVVNVANLRHLWLVDESPDFGWAKPR